MSDNTSDTETGDTAAFGEVPVEVTITVGRARPTINDLLAMSSSTVMTLDTTLEDPVELYVGERLIARGHLEELDASGSGNLGVRITEVIQPKGSA